MVKVRATSRTEWENLASGVFVPLHIVGQGQPFLASMDHRDLSHAALTRVRSTEGEVVRTEDLIGDADTDVALFSFQLKGTSEVVQGRNSSVVPPAYGVLYLADIPYRLRFHAMTDLMIVRASASALGLPANTLLGAAASSMRLQDAPALKLLSRIVGSYLSDRPLMPSAAETARVSVELLGEAIAGIAGSISRPRSRAALRAAVLARITSGLADPRLDVSMLANAEHVSVRTVHAVFADAGSSPAREIRHARLERARRLLDGTNLPIMAIALSCGFTDATTFTRTFRREHGEAPGIYRSRARTLESNQTERHSGPCGSK